MPWTVPPQRNSLLEPRAFSAAAPPGTYTLSVRAVNACGAGPATAFQTITVQ